MSQASSQRDRASAIDATELFRQRLDQAAADSEALLDTLLAAEPMAG